MIKQPDRFLLAENPINQSRVYILHTVDPKCLIELVCLNDEPCHVKGYDFEYVNTDGVLEYWRLFINQAYEEVPDAEQLINRAWRWWVAYLKWEDKNIDSGDF